MEQRAYRPKVPAYWRVRERTKAGVKAEAIRRQLSEADAADQLISERLAQLAKQRKAG